LLLYSDGLSEAENPAGEEYGQERLEKLLAANRNFSAAKLLSACLTDLHAFRGNNGNSALADDLTVMLVQRARASA
jgi:serine phosphatase RsbU (regulator of sigma subunit)